MAGKVTQKGDTIYLNIGQRWFQYNERSLLGSGAMGTVYKGYDCNSGEPVAIKRVKDNYANNPEIRYRAHQEADLMFRHPNLVEMLGCCEMLTYGLSQMWRKGYVNYFSLCSMPCHTSIRRVSFIWISNPRTS